jgi:hypothetical protein
MGIGATVTSAGGVTAINSRDGDPIDNGEPRCDNGRDPGPVLDAHGPPSDLIEAIQY